MIYSLYHFFVIFYKYTGSCRRHVKFSIVNGGYALQGHVIKNLTLQLDVRNPCRGQCVMESRCVSYNIGPQINNKVTCELSDSDHYLNPQDLKPRPGFTYTGTEVRKQNTAQGNIGCNTPLLPSPLCP